MVYMHQIIFFMLGGVDIIAVELEMCPFAIELELL